MKATPLEFRLRYLIHAVIYALGFTAPWDLVLHLDSGLTTWLAAASWTGRTGWLSFNSATILLLLLGIALATMAAFIRTWASAYLGPAVVQDSAMHGERVLAAGPFRRVRNPLYLGTFVHTLALGLLMPPSGTIFTIVAIGLVQIRLILAEEAFLTASLGERYTDYLRSVPRLLPAASPRLALPAAAPAWPAAFLGEIYMWGVALSFAVMGWRYNAHLMLQGVIVSLGISMIVRATMPGKWEGPRK